MKKIFVTILLFSLLLQVNAGRKFYKIGNYTKVEILKITAKGIQVLHSYGIGYITDENLSESEKKLLQPEIEQYHKLKNIRAANIEKITNSQTLELDDLIKRLPGMKYNELQAWSKKRVGVYIPHKKFEEKYSQTFYFAKNKSLFYKMLIKKVKTLQTEKLNDLTKNLPKMSWKEMQIWCKQNTGIYLTNKHFWSKFDNIFSMVEEKDFCKETIKIRTQEIYNEFLMNFAEKLCKMSPVEIDRHCKKIFGFRYSNKKFRKKLEEQFCFSNKFHDFTEKVNKHIKCCIQEDELKNVERLSIEELYFWLERHHISFEQLDDIKKKFDCASNSTKVITIIKQKVPELIKFKKEYQIREQEERREREIQNIIKKMESVKKNTENTERLRQMQFRRCGNCNGVGVVNNVVVNGQYRNWYACPACNGRGGTGGRQLIRSY